MRGRHIRHVVCHIRHFLVKSREKSHEDTRETAKFLSVTIAPLPYLSLHNRKTNSNGVVGPPGSRKIRTGASLNTSGCENQYLLPALCCNYAANRIAKLAVRSITQPNHLHDRKALVVFCMIHRSLSPQYELR